jgi:hypothetical protein
LIMMILGPIGLQHHGGRCFSPWVELTTEGIAPRKPALKPILSARTTILGPIGLQHHGGRCFSPWVELTTEGIAPRKAGPQADFVRAYDYSIVGYVVL